MFTKDSLKIIPTFLKSILRNVFQISLVAYIFFLFLEKLAPGIVSTYFGLDNLLPVIIISGAISFSFTDNQKKTVIVRSKIYDTFFLATLAFLAAVIVFIKANTGDYWGYFLAAFCGILIFLVGYLFLEE